MKHLSIQTTPLEGLRTLERLRIADQRGDLTRLFCSAELSEELGGRLIVQMNLTRTSHRTTVRGLHLQTAPYCEMKIVTCVAGSIFDVAVDLRRGSPTFLHWHSVELTGSNRRSLVIPEGFAHGFQAMEDDCQVLYLHTAPYQPMHEFGVNAADPRLAIDWPLPVGPRSDRDSAHPLLQDSFQGVAL